MMKHQDSMIRLEKKTSLTSSIKSTRYLSINRQPEHNLFQSITNVDYLKGVERIWTSKICLW